MIQTFIEKNKKLLLFCCWAARIGGWGLIVLTPIPMLGYLKTLIGNKEGFQAFLTNQSLMNIWPMINCFLIGLLSLGVAQFLRYLFDLKCKPGWILQHGSKILYIYSALIVCYHIQGYITESKYFSCLFDSIASSFAMIIFVGVKLLILVGLALILKRIMPVIEESRTLV